MKISIRKSEKSDSKIISKIIQESFKHDIHSDQREHFLVEKLQKSKDFIPELSLVAEVNEEIVGFIMLTKVTIINEFESHEALALAPVSVAITSQNKGVGSKLIKKAHKKAKKMGFDCIVLLGHEKYYPKFGYKFAKLYKIEFPFDAPDENCFVKFLNKNKPKHINGIIKYPAPFYE